MEFKKSPTPDLSDLTYDNANDFPCTMSKQELDAARPDQIEDIMCRPRPGYLKEYKNPCFLDTSNPNETRLDTFCHPYFHILGFDKCGTTDFHSRLTSHQEILFNFGVVNKELYFWSWLRFGNFFDRKYQVSKLWQYKHRFPHRRIIDGLAKDKVQLITGDATPLDAWEFRYWPGDPQNKGLIEPRFLTPHAMRHVYANPKFILLMRDPVERLYSDYIFLRHGKTPEEFARDVLEAVSVVKDCLKTYSLRHCIFSEEMYTNLPMRIQIGCYSVFLREWFSVFDRRHFLIFRTEDYHNNTKEYLRQAFDFLQVSQLSESELEKISNKPIKHETALKKIAGPMLPETRAILEEFYARFNEDLASLLNDSRFLWRDAEISF
ncbi:Carbohydrate sulfotransferase 15 [Bulinus truncatus]|nr:Carbohydrate sulfotransferase 15 [Bulinus truncatus]